VLPYFGEIAPIRFVAGFLIPAARPRKLSSETLPMFTFQTERVVRVTMPAHASINAAVSSLRLPLAY